MQKKWKVLAARNGHVNASNSPSAYISRPAWRETWYNSCMRPFHSFLCILEHWWFPQKCHPMVDKTKWPTSDIYFSISMFFSDFCHWFVSYRYIKAHIKNSFCLAHLQQALLYAILPFPNDLCKLRKCICLLLYTLYYPCKDWNSQMEKSHFDVINIADFQILSWVCLILRSTAPTIWFFRVWSGVMLLHQQEPVWWIFWQKQMIWGSSLQLL